MDLESDYQVPPPAYSEEEEFDQKVSIATEISAHASVADADGWEVYDPYAFENHSDMGVSKSEWPGHIHSSSTHIRIEKIPQSKSVDSVQLSPLNKYSMKDHQMQHANSVASSSQWHEADSLPGKGTLQRSEAYTSASFSLHCPQDIPPDGVYYAASCKDLPSPQVWQPERHTPLRYSFDAQPPAPYRASYQDTRIDAQSEYDGSAQSRRLRSLPPTPTPPRRQLLFQERPMASYHPIQPPVIKFDTSIAYSNTPSSPSLPHHHPASARPDAKYDSYSFYKCALRLSNM